MKGQGEDKNPQNPVAVVCEWPLSLHLRDCGLLCLLIIILTLLKFMKRILQ